MTWFMLEIMCRYIPAVNISRHISHFFVYMRVQTSSMHFLRFMKQIRSQPVFLSLLEITTHKKWDEIFLQRWNREAPQDLCHTEKTGENPCLHFPSYRRNWIFIIFFNGGERLKGWSGASWIMLTKSEKRRCFLCQYEDMMD